MNTDRHIFNVMYAHARQSQYHNQSHLLQKARNSQKVYFAAFQMLKLSRNKSHMSVCPFPRILYGYSIILLPVSWSRRLSTTFIAQSIHYSHDCVLSLGTFDDERPHTAASDYRRGLTSHNVEEETFLAFFSLLSRFL